MKRASWSALNYALEIEATNVRIKKAGSQMAVRDLVKYRARLSEEMEQRYGIKQDLFR